MTSPRLAIIRLVRTRKGNRSFRRHGSLRTPKILSPNTWPLSLTVAELSTGKDGLKIKLHDPKAAIKQLAGMCGWEAPKKAELTGANGGPIQTSNLTPDEAAEAYRKMMG